MLATALLLRRAVIHRRPVPAPLQPARGVSAVVSTIGSTKADRIGGGWRTGLPVLTGSLITLRELRVSDATALFEALTTEEVTRFLSPPPTTVDGFERFVDWTLKQRDAG